jgi:hypothetical protein
LSLSPEIYPGKRLNFCKIYTFLLVKKLEKKYLKKAGRKGGLGLL